MMRENNYAQNEVSDEFLQTVENGDFVASSNSRNKRTFWKVVDSTNRRVRCSVERIDDKMFFFPGIFCRKIEDQRNIRRVQGQ